MKSLSNLIKLIFYTPDMWKQVRKMKADQMKNGDRYLCQAWCAVRGSASYHPRRWWIVSPTDADMCAQSQYVDFIVIFALAAIYGVATGIIGGLTEIVGYPPLLRLAICLTIDAFCVWQLYGLVKNAFQRRKLNTSLQNWHTAQ